MVTGKGTVLQKAKVSGLSSAADEALWLLH